MRMNAYSYAMMLLSRQDYSEKKLSESLLKKSFERDEVEEVVGILSSEGIIDDLRYAKLYVESKKNKYGRRRLEFFLREKQIRQAIIDEALSELDECEELSGAIEVAQKKYKMLCGKVDASREDRKRNKNKLFDALMRAGYSIEIAKKAMDIVLDECEL